MFLSALLPLKYVRMPYLLQLNTFAETLHIRNNTAVVVLMHCRVFSVLCTIL